MFYNYSALIILSAIYLIPLSGNGRLIEMNNRKTLGLKRKTSTISLRLPQHDKEWRYGQNWPSLGFEDCGKTHQSPIRIFSSTARVNNSLNFKLENYDVPIVSAFIENNGHTVQVGFSDQIRASIIGSATDNERYVFCQLHFHWGSYDGVGSEHKIDGIRYSMEVHFVHYKQSYGSFDEAVDKPDGLLVLGSLYRISSRNNKFFSCVIKLVKSVPRYKDKAMLLEPFTLRSLLPNRLKPFYRYHGSITSPPCFESVKWLVFGTPIDISSEQEKQFRKCRGEHRSYRTGRLKPLSNNFRPIQAINDREVQMCT